VSARVDVFLRYFCPFPRSIMVEQDATQLMLKYYSALPQAKLSIKQKACTATLAKYVPIS